MTLMFLRSDEGSCSHIDFLLNTMCNWAAVDIRSRKSTQSSSIYHGNNDAAKGETIFFRSLWHLTKAFLESCHWGRIFNEYPRVLSDSDVNDQHVAMFLTTCYNHECFIINEHGSGATYWYGDEDFMSQWKQLARKVHKNTLEFRMIMRWLLRVRHPDLAAWGKRRLISLWNYPQDLIESIGLLSDFYRIWMSSLFEDIGSYSGNVLKNRGRSWMYDIFTYIGACGYNLVDLFRDPNA